MTYQNKVNSDIIIKDNEERCVSLGQYIITNKTTVRATAKAFGISKTTVHQDITARLEKINPSLHEKVKNILEKNKQERHIRGSQATKLKYVLKLRENK